MNRLVALDLPAGPAWVDALQRAWDDGDAVLPVDQRLPGPARDDLLARMRPALIRRVDGIERGSDGEGVDPGDALVVATSGSTGVPKGVVLTHAAVAASARATSERLGVEPADRWLACLPLAHIGGLSVVTRAIFTGTPLTVLPEFDADRVTAAARAGATLVSLVPTALRRVDPARFRRVVLGGSRPPDALPANVVTTYGMTETGSGVVYDGIPLEGVELRLDIDGEILLRGAMLLRGYRDGTDPRDADGWLRTGDLGRLEPNGRLAVDGRRGDLIITGGENVWPEPVETVLRTCTGVGDVAIVARPDPEWGQVVVAVVVPTAEPPRLADLRAAVKAVLPTYSAPRELLLVASLPRTALGKLKRGDVMLGAPAED